MSKVKTSILFNELVNKARTLTEELRGFGLESNDIQTVFLREVFKRDASAKNSHDLNFSKQVGNFVQ